MVTCPKCKGEGEVRTAGESVSFLATRAGAAAKLWGRRTAIGLGLIAVVPMMTTLFWGFAHFIRLLTGAELRQGTHKLDYFGRVVENSQVGEVTFLAGLIVTIGVVAGLVALGVIINALVNQKEPAK